MTGLLRDISPVFGAHTTKNGEHCRFLTSLSFGPNQAIIAGQIVHAYVDDQFVLDRARGLVDTPRLKLIGGMHGAKWYAKLSDRFEMERPTWAEWVREGKVK
jgi:hypothetical protein